MFIDSSIAWIAREKENTSLEGWIEWNARFDCVALSNARTKVYLCLVICELPEPRFEG
jgi:hypothetical protein